MEKIYTWIKTVSTLLIVISLIKNLLPGNSYDKYFNAFLGMLVVYVICSPLSGDYSISDVVLGGISFIESEAESLYSEEELNAFSYSFTVSEYERILKMQIGEEAVAVGFEVETVEIEMNMGVDDTYGEIKSVTVICSSEDYTDEEVEELCSRISGMLGIDEGSIDCFY